MSSASNALTSVPYTRTATPKIGLTASGLHSLVVRKFALSLLIAERPLDSRNAAIATMITRTRQPAAADSIRNARSALRPVDRDARPATTRSAVVGGEAIWFLLVILQWVGRSAGAACSPSAGAGGPGVDELAQCLDRVLHLGGDLRRQR